MRNYLLLVPLLALCAACDDHGMSSMMVPAKTVSAAPLPDADSAGAKLVSKYCTQCHGLPSPKSHTSIEWPALIERMTSHMQANGKQTPVSDELHAIKTYFQAHAR